MSRFASAAPPTTVPRDDARLVLQARMGSSRLPGKVLAELGGQSILAHCIDRLLAAQVGEVIVATTIRAEDDAVVAEAERFGVRTYRGAVEDVLDRYAGAVADWTGPYVIRATADNPLVDIETASRVLRALDLGADYAVEEGLPIGAAVEGVRTEVLREAAALATTAHDREHVTPFIRQHTDRYVVRMLPAPPALRRPTLRLTVDTRHDLQFVRGLVEQAGSPRPALTEILALAARSAGWAGVA
jgi:spore coat polysaccharide biosynthesis protein SpsF